VTGLLALALLVAGGLSLAWTFQSNGSDRAEFFSDFLPAEYEFCTDCAINAWADRLPGSEIEDAFRDVLRPRANAPEPPLDGSWGEFGGVCAFVVMAAPVIFHGARALPLDREAGGLSRIVFRRPPDQAEQRARRVAEFAIGAVNNRGWPGQPRSVKRKREQAALLDLCLHGARGQNADS
jgi:hypothetical protein